MDAECTSVAMDALEREGGFSSRGTAGIPAGGGEEPAVDFTGFVAAVRAVILFGGALPPFWPSGVCVGSSHALKELASLARGSGCLGRGIRLDDWVPSASRREA